MTTRVYTVETELRQLKMQVMRSDRKMNWVLVLTVLGLGLRVFQLWGH